MKFLFTILIELCSVTVFSQSTEPITVEMSGTTFRSGDKITFYVNCDKVYTAEIAVFCDNFLGYHTNSALTPGRHEYTVAANIIYLLVIFCTPKVSHNRSLFNNQSVTMSV